MPSHPQARWAIAGLLALVAWWGPMAGVATADPPRPTDYRATITGISPATEAIDVSVIGGDAFLQLRVEPGHEVVVLGYRDEPYLRFDAAGTVSENMRSQTTYANADRYGDVEMPSGLDPEAAPEWRRIGGGGRHAWHDHRIHLMSPQPPAGVTRGSEIERWTVPVVVDGERVTISGALRYEPAVAWWPWAVGSLAAAGIVWALSRRVRPALMAAVAAGTACALAVSVAVAEQLAIPSDAGRSLVKVAVPAVGLLFMLVAVLARRPRVTEVATLAAVAAAGGWAFLRLEVLTKPVLPTVLAPNLDRAGTAGALGLALAAAFVCVALGQDRSIEG